MSKMDLWKTGKTGSIFYSSRLNLSIEKQSASFSFLKVSDEYVLNDLAQVIPCDPSGAEGIISFLRLCNIIQ